MNIKFSELHKTHNKFYSEAMNIYLDSFPANERQSIELVKKRIESGKSKLHIGKINDKVVCIGMLWYFEKNNFVLLDYMAVKTNYRNIKIGSCLFKYISTTVITENKSLILEVEHPGYGENKLERKKRVLFYLNNGAFIFDNTPYILPPLDNTIHTEMILMVYPTSQILKFNNKDIKELVIHLYNELYQRDINDDLLNSFINDIPQIITISKKIPYDKH